MLYRLFLLLCPALLVAQTDTDISNDQRPESEVHAAADPNDSDLLIAAAVNDLSPGSGTLNSRLSVYYSHDGGFSWTRSTYHGGGQSYPLQYTADPTVAFDQDGTAYLAHLVWVPGGNNQLTSHIVVSESTDGGVSWSETTARTTNSVLDKPWLFADPNNGTLYLTYLEATGSFWLDYNVRLQRLAPGADHWTDPVTINQQNYNGPVNFPTGCVAPDGRVTVGYVASNNGIQMRANTSTDGGVTWSDDRLIAPMVMYYSDFTTLVTLSKIGLERLYPCQQLAYTPDGTLHLTYTDRESGFTDYGLDVYHRRSTDHGNTWTDRQSLTPGLPPLRNQYYAALTTAPDGTLYTTWYDRRTDPLNRQTHFYLGKLDAAGTLTESTQLTTQPTDFFYIGNQNDGFGVGEYTALIATDDYVLAIWPDGRQNNGRIDLYATRLERTESTPTVTARSGLDAPFSVGKPYPNPVADFCWVPLHLTRSLDLHYRLTDLAGKTVWERRSGRLPVGQQALDVPVAQLARGGYWLTVSDGSVQQSVRIEIP